MPYPPGPQNTRILLPKDVSTAFCVRAVNITLLPTSTNVGAYWGHALCHTPFILPSLRFQGFCCSVLIALISSQLRTRVASGSYLQRNLTFLDKFAPMLLKRHSKLEGVYRSPIVWAILFIRSGYWVWVGGSQSAKKRRVRLHSRLVTYLWSV